MRNKALTVHIIVIIMLIGFALSIWLMGERNGGKIVYVGTSENFSARLASSYFTENWFFFGKKIETSIGGKELTIQYIGDRKNIAKDTKITFAYDFSDVECTGEIIGLEPQNDIVHKSNSGSYEISEQDKLIIHLTIDGKAEVVELKEQK